MSKRLRYHAERFGLVMVDPVDFELSRVTSRAGKQTIRFGEGDTVADEAVIDRIAALVIPPAWQDVKICLDADGHIQAVGRDEKGRLQYRYNDRWVDVRNAVKTERMLRFGRALPKLRRRIFKDMRRKEMDGKATAAVAARLVDVAALRSGHEKYAADGGRGVASLQKGNFRLSKSVGVLDFVGKSNKAHRIEITDRPLLKSLQRVRKTRGQRLFTFKEPGRKTPKLMTATVLNQYLRDAAGAKVSAKDFRTFHGSAEALRFLIEEAGTEIESEKKRKRAVASAMRSVSEILRNTPTVARASYVHPDIVAAYEEERLDPDLLKGRSREGLTRVETGLMRFLEEVATR